MHRLTWPIALLLLATPMAAAESCNPPCGYIVPLMDLDVQDKPICTATLGQPVQLDQCIALPAEGESVVFDAVLDWEWEVSEDGTYPNDPQTDIEISFQGVNSNPSWMSFTVEPDAMRITAADLASPLNLQQREKEGSQTGAVWFYKGFPVTVTLSREGSPTPEEAADIAKRSGQIDLMIKVKSSESGERFKPAWYVEKFTFDGSSVMADKDAPAPALGLVMALGLLLVATRRGAQRDQ